MLVRWSLNSGWSSLSFWFFVWFMMNIFCWNIKGAMNMTGRRFVRKLAKKHHIDIVIILEPRYQFCKVSKFCDKLGYIRMAVSEANGHSGGIWVLGLKGYVVFSVLDIFPQVISIQIGGGTGDWICSAMYGCLALSHRDDL